MIHTIFYFLLLFGALAAFLLIPKKKETKRFGVIILAVALIFEIGIVNFHSFHLWFGGYKKTSVDFAEYDVVPTGLTLEDDGETFVQSGKNQAAQVVIRHIGKKIGTIHITASFPDSETGKVNPGYVSVRVDAKDVTQSASYRTYLAEGQIISGEDRTAYIPVDLSGEVSELRIIFTTPEEDVTVRYEDITFNESVPMRFSALRLGLFLGIAFALYALFTFNSLRSAYEGQEKKFLYASCIMTACFVVLGVTLSIMECGLPDFKMTYGNQMTKELVDAFEHGQVSLLDTPPKELLELENPYDWSLRSGMGLAGRYKWDHLLFEGKYYSYYGIAPVILLFLPYHLVTGYYFPSNFAILLFGLIGIVCLTLTFLEFVKRHARGVSFGILLCTLFVMQMSSGVFYNFMRGNFYEIAQSAGFAFVTAGFFFLMKSGITAELEPGEKIRKWALCLSSVCLSLAVLSRPTLALYCVCAVLFIGYGFYRNLMRAKENGEKPKTSDTVKYFLASLLPYVVIGGVQAVYNYMRFGSFLDFGIQYSLTINDFTRSQYHTDFVMIGLYNFLAAFPIVKPEFPFFFSNFSTLGTNGYYYVANTNAVGLFWRSLPMWGYLGAGKAFKLTTKEERKKLLLLVLPVCIIAPLIIIFSIWESGYGVRYCADFAWELILGGCVCLYLIYMRGADGTGKKIMERFFAISALIAFFINGAMLWAYIETSSEALTLSLKIIERLFNFWI